LRGNDSSGWDGALPLKARIVIPAKAGIQFVIVSRPIIQWRRHTNLAANPQPAALYPANENLAKIRPK